MHARFYFRKTCVLVCCKTKQQDPASRRMPTPGPPPRRIASWPSPARLRRPARRAHRSTRHSSRATRTGRQRLLRQPQARPRTPGACLRERQGSTPATGTDSVLGRTAPFLPSLSGVRPPAPLLPLLSTSLLLVLTFSACQAPVPLTTAFFPAAQTRPIQQLTTVKTCPILIAVKTSVHQARHLLTPTPADAPTTNAPCCIGVENWGYGSGVSIAANPNTVRCSIHHH